MTFFGKQRNKTLIDQQAFVRVNEVSKKRKRKLIGVFFKLFFVLLGLFLITFLSIRLPSLYTKVAKPFNNLQSDYYQTNSINLNRRTNILLATLRDQKLKELAVASYEQGKKKIVVLKLPLNLMVFDSEGGRSVSDLITLNKNEPKQIDKLTAAVIETIGYVPDGFVLLEDTSDWLKKNSLDEVVGLTTFSPKFFLNLRENKNYLDKHLYTNLTIGEFYELTSAVKRTPPERFEFVDVSAYQNQNGTLDQTSLINEVGVKLNDAKILDGNFAVEVVNESGVDGLGFVFKTILSNLGVNIVTVSSSTEEREKSLIEVSSGSEVLVDKLEGLLGSEIKRNKNIGNVDVKVILGKDFGNFFDY